MKPYNLLYAYLRNFSYTQVCLEMERSLRIRKKRDYKEMNSLKLPREAKAGHKATKHQLYPIDIVERKDGRAKVH